MVTSDKIVVERYEQDLKDIGRALRHARVTAGLSMRQLHFETGIFPYLISNIENAKQGTRVETLHRLFNCLGVTIKEAFDNLTLYEED